MKKTRHSNGFTLVETLVATTLTVLVCALVAQIATNSLNAVHHAGSRVTATEKLDQLRKRLAADLELVPVATGIATLTASADGGTWSLTLRLPMARPLAETPWRTIRYQWSASTGEITRSEQTEGAAEEREGNVIATGVSEWEVRWLAAASNEAAGGPLDWSSTTSIPAAAAVRARFSGAWEEGERGQSSAAPEPKAREFRWSMGVGG